MIIPSNALMQLVLEAIQKHIVSGSFTGALYQPWVMLFTGAPTLNSGTVLGDIAEATYTGYARQQITAWGADYISQDGFVAVDGPALQFQPTGTITVQNIITGWALVTAGSAGTYLAGEMLAQAAPLQTLFDSLTILAKLEFPGTSGLGQGVIVN